MARKPLRHSIPNKTQTYERRKKFLCTYCNQKGHLAYFCPNTPNDDFESNKEFSKEEKEFIRELMTSPKINPEEYKGNFAAWKERGETINAKNPFTKRTASSHIDRMRASLGFWKAAGAPTNVICPGSETESKHVSNE